MSSTRFFALVFPLTFIVLLAGWADAAPDQTPDQAQTGRCVVIETLVTAPDGSQSIRRKVRCEYAAGERRVVKGAR